MNRGGKLEMSERLRTGQRAELQATLTRVAVATLLASS